VVSKDLEVKNIEIPSNQTKGTIKTQDPKDKTLTCNKETQMAGQHELATRFCCFVNFILFLSLFLLQQITN